MLAKEGYMPERPDFRAALTKVRAARPDIVFLAGYAEIGTILNQAKELGLNVQFLGSVPTENPHIVQ